jgi:integrase
MLDHIKANRPPPNAPPPKVGLTGLTLRDVMTRVESAPALTTARRGEILSGLRTLARCVGRDPGDIPAQPVSLSKALKDAPYTLAGVGKRRWDAVRYLTLAGLRAAGFKVMSGRRTATELSPAWQELLSLAPDRQSGIGLSRFISYCSAAGIEPPDVDLAVFERFQHELEHNSIVPNARFIYRTTCTLWNKASKSVPPWPSLELGVPNASKRYSLEWDAFSKSFQADVDAFLGNAGNQDPLSDNYAPSVRPATILTRRKAIRQMATALVLAEYPAAEIHNLGTLVKAENAKRILQFFLKRACVGKESVYGHAVLLRTIARHWVMRDEENILKLEKFCKGLTPKKHGMTDKNRSRLRQFDDVRNIDALLSLPSKLLRQAQRCDSGGKGELTAIIYALAIELLIVAPVRIKNLTTLEVDRHIVHSRRRPHPIVHLVVPGDEVKNGVAFEVALPKGSAELLNLYLQSYRPRISSVSSPWLFPNAAGRQRHIVGFGRQISAVIKRHTGLKVHPHLFRHFSVKLILESRPEGFETARLTLGHKSLRTTMRAYSEGKTTAAHKTYEALIEARRDEARKRPSQKPKVPVSK